MYIVAYILVIYKYPNFCAFYFKKLHYNVFDGDLLKI